MTTTLEPPSETEVQLTPSRAETALIATLAHNRVSIPINLDSWKGQPAEYQDLLLWFHSHMLDNDMDLKEGGQAIGYDHSTVFRVLKGDYVGSWKNIIDAIRGYKKTADLRGMIQQAEFAENGITKMIFNSLDYALANNSISLIIGESGQGKTFAVENWKAQNPHKAVMVTAPAYGGAKMLLADICMEVGAGRKLNIYDAKSALKKAFNKNRILIVDEAHRLLPGERQTQPRGLEFLRDLRDQSKCGLAVVATTRFDVEIRKSDYLYEQFLGRSLTTRLPKKIREADIEPIVRQYVGRATAEAMGVCLSVANNTYRHEAEKDSKGRVIRYADLDRGRIRILVEILKLASRQAKKAGEKCSSEFIFKAVATRMQFQGEL